MLGSVGDDSQKQRLSKNLHTADRLNPEIQFNPRETTCIIIISTTKYQTITSFHSAPRGILEHMGCNGVAGTLGRRQGDVKLYEYLPK